MEKSAFLDEKIIDSILDKVREVEHLGIISFSELFELLNRREDHLIKKFLKLNPGDFGFKGKFIGMRIITGNLISVNGEFLVKPVWAAFLGMNEAMESDIGKKLKIFNGYRSPAYQTIVFLLCLKENNFDFLRTAKGVAFPGYSEHGDPVHQAIDVYTANGALSNIGPVDFEKTKECKWLMQNANKYGFYMSYPEDNKDGIMFEPWHWRHNG